ncbi:MAG: hypothetical protein K2K15_02945 [Anaeroplasmataceae bacterium]|nr:hypothetical protein [Anaeroplasmataceae bacterium]
MAMIGALPIPNRYSGMRSFKQAIHQHITKKHVIMIYPEGHVWPYYTKIRPFVSTSFSYPLIEGAPVYCFTVTYQKGWIRTHITAYVDGPFYASSGDDSKKQMEELRNQVFEKMKERSRWSTFEKRIYRRKEDKK